MFYKKEWGETYTEYDPDTANRLLDEIGLTEKDNNGFRLGPDGKPITINIVTEGAEPKFVPTNEIVKHYWKAVGIDSTVKGESIDYIQLILGSGDYHIVSYQNDAMAQISNWTAATMKKGLNQVYWPGMWERWWDSNERVSSGRATLADFPDGKLPGEEPPEEIKELFEKQQAWGKTDFGSAEYIELATEIFDFYAENLFGIGTVGEAPVLLLVSEKLGNIPTQFATTQTDWQGGLQYHDLQFFFKD